jgi:hypothetical protein
MKRDLYAEVTNKIVAKLETGVMPWVKGWNAGTSIPMNAVTNRGDVENRVFPQHRNGFHFVGIVAVCYLQLLEINDSLAIFASSHKSTGFAGLLVCQVARPRIALVG